jgi:hypothetical protein
MIFWFLFQVPIKAYTLKGQWNGKIEELLTFWNIIDGVRLISLFTFIVLLENSKISSIYAANAESFTTIISWISLLEHLRLY